MKEKITKHVDKIIMGAIIGGAIGSVLGMKLSKRKQNETVSQDNPGNSAEAEKPKKKGLLRRLLGL